MIQSKDNNFVFFTLEDIVNKMIPSKIIQVQETIMLDTDKAIAVMRFFNWNLERA